MVPSYRPTDYNGRYLVTAQNCSRFGTFREVVQPRPISRYANCVHPSNLLSLLRECPVLNRRGTTHWIEWAKHVESDLKESPSLPRCERCDLRLIPLVVQSSDFRWTSAPRLREWPDELLIDFPDFPDHALDSAANTATPVPARCCCLEKTAIIGIYCGELECRS